MKRFLDRYSAGRILAREVRGVIGEGSRILVLALPRGGVPVGIAVAAELHAQLDILCVRKLGVPGHEELAFGAIAPDGVRVVDQDTVFRFRLSQDAVAEVENRERRELLRREKLFRGDRPKLNIAGRTIILVDDGLATGATMRAALAWVKKENPARIIVAAPVASAEACGDFRGDQDCECCICKLVPRPLLAVGSWYDDFPQLRDETVIQMLERARLEFGPPRDNSQAT